MRIAIVTGLIASCVGAYVLYRYHHSLNAENLRLKTIVEAEFERVSTPSESMLVYQEVDSDRVCKTAKITKLYATEKPAADICGAIYAPLKNEGWKSQYGCRVITYPFKDSDNPPYDYYSLAAGSTSNKFGVAVSVQPKDAWGSLSMLSDFGTHEAIPLARKAGKTFFTIKMSYTEDHALFDSYCPENLSHCDCSSTLFAWEFPDGRHFSRSW